LELAPERDSVSSAPEPIILPVPEDETSHEHEEATPACSDQGSALLKEILEGHGGEPDPVVQENPVPETPVFVTRSTYAHVDGIATERESSEATEETTERSQGAATAHPFAAEPQVLTELGLSGGSGKSRHTIELILAVVLLSWALVFLGYQMGSTGVSRESAKEAAATAAAKMDETSSKSLVPSVEASPAPTRESATALTVGDAGMVLQVGAMKVEDNADAMAQELQKKNLPAFVFRHGSDGLYRVAVGPYSDDETAAKAKAGLEKQGYKPILRRWLPE
jgi:cell division septation protein DedD